MTQEERQLLFIDICGRLPYGIKANCCSRETVDIIAANPDYETLYVRSYSNNYPTHWDKIDCYTPYLRPMTSMTEEEKIQYRELCDEDMRQLSYVQTVHPGLKDKTSCHRSIDWLNKKMFDYRCLIEKGLVLEAPEDMYNIKEK